MRASLQVLCAPRGRGVVSLLGRGVQGGSSSSRGAATQAALQEQEPLQHEEEVRTDPEWEAARPFEQIPGPRPLPLIGNIWRFLPGIGELSNTDFVQQHKVLHARHGSLVRVTKLPGRHDLVFVFSPQDVKKVFQHEGVWPSRPILQCFHRYRTEHRKDVYGGEGGLVTDQGEKWHAMRSQVNPVMMQTRNVQIYAQKINDVAQEFIDMIPDMLNDKQETPDHFLKELHKWALESIAVVALDTRLGCLSPTPDPAARSMVSAVHQMFDSIHALEFGLGLWRFVSTPQWRKFVRTMDIVVDACLDHVERARQRIAEGDGEARSVLERILLRDHTGGRRAVIMAMDMLMAGVDTTSHAGTTALLHLCRHPSAQERLHSELVELMPQADTPLTAELLGRMTYLKAVIKESMRLGPIVPANARTTTRPIVLSNYRIPVGVDVILCNGLMSRSETLCPAAAEFRPERWMRPSRGTGEQGRCPEAALELKPEPFVTLPFGHGARTCVGRRFASLELEVLLAKLVRNFRFSWHGPEMNFRSSLVQVPMDPLRFTLTPRN